MKFHSTAGFSWDGISEHMIICGAKYGGLIVLLCLIEQYCSRCDEISL
jgi:hypothetical protein